MDCAFCKHCIMMQTHTRAPVAVPARSPSSIEPTTFSFALRQSIRSTLIGRQGSAAGVAIHGGQSWRTEAACHARLCQVHRL